MNIEQMNLGKIYDKGVNNPFIARIFLQFSEMLNKHAFQFSEEKTKKINDMLFALMKDMLEVEDEVEKFHVEENQAIEKVNRREGVSVRPNGVSFHDPSEQLFKSFENSIIRSTIALRKLSRIVGIIDDLDFKDGLGKLNKHLEKVFSGDAELLKMLKDDKVWIEKLVDLRTKSEHGELRLERFTVGQKDGQVYIIPTYLDKNGEPLIGYLKSLLGNILTFSEEVLANLLNKKCIWAFSVIELPESESKKHNNARFILAPSEKLNHQLHESTDTKKADEQ